MAKMLRYVMDVTDLMDGRTEVHMDRETWKLKYHFRWMSQSPFFDFQSRYTESP